MNDKLKKRLKEFHEACRKDGVIPEVKIIFNPLILDGLSTREKKLVGFIVDTYLQTAISPKPIPCKKMPSSKEPRKTLKTK